MTVEQIIKDDEENGSIIFNYGLMHNLAVFGAISAYSGICGGGYEAAHQWVDHNVYDINEVENSKYRGWIITDSDGREHKVYIPMWVLNIKTTDWKKAFNLFKKYLTVKR
jgi:hypothetical protein